MPRAEQMTILKVPLEDKPGSLLKVLRGLKDGEVNLAGMWGFSMGQGKAELLMSSQDPDKLEKALGGMAMKPERGIGFFVKGSDRPGALIETVEAISGAGINIEAADAIAVDGNFGSFIWVRPEDVGKAEEALSGK